MSPPTLLRGRPAPHGATPRLGSTAWCHPVATTRRAAAAAATRRDALLAAAAVAPCLCGACFLRTPPGQRAYKSLFAAVMADGMASYEREVASIKRPLLERAVARLRASTGRPLDVVDVGVGAAPNARFLAAADVATYTGVDPNDAMRPYAARAAAAAGLPFAFVRGDAATLAAGGADLAIVTLVLCSVPDVAAAVAGVAAALRPGGRLVFVEHVAADAGARPGLALAQRLLSPLQSALADGCRLTRDPEPALRGAGGLVVESVASFDVAGGGVIAPHKAGVAVRVA